jgi:hypothetical protein
MNAESHIAYVVPVNIEGADYVVDYYAGSESGDLYSRVYRLRPYGRIRVPDKTPLAATIRRLAWSRLKI